MRTQLKAYNQAWSIMDNVIIVMPYLETVTKSQILLNAKDKSGAHAVVPKYGGSYYPEDESIQVEGGA